VAQAVGYPSLGEVDSEEQLLASLPGRQMLLVMDNLEHWLESGKLIARMLACAPRLKILCTSRERLNLHAETLFRLHGLAYPPSSDQAQTYAAFQLFVRAAQRAQPEFEPTDDEVLHISRICQLTEGMPLGLELAAAWMEALTPAQIAEEISGSLSILQAAVHDVPERHHSMDAVFEHSWQLLADSERVVFTRLSTFCGGFDRSAAEDVAGATLFTLSTLIDKSLVIRIGPDRFKLHELLRQFAEAKLRADEKEHQRILHRHCQHYANRAQAYEARIKTDISLLFGSLLDIQKDFDNFMTGWNRALEMPFVTEIGQYAYCIGILLAFRGLHTIGEQTFAQAFQVYQSRQVPVNPSDQVRVMTHYGRFLSDRGQSAQAFQLLQNALDLASASSSVHATDTGVLLCFLGWAQYLTGQPDDGQTRLQQGLDTCQAAGDQYGTWIGHGLLGELAYGRGQYELAYQHHANGLMECERYRHLSGLPYTLMLLGCTSCALGDTDRANDYLQRGLEANRGFLFVVPLLLAVLGIAALYERHGQPETALELAALVRHHHHWGGALPELKLRSLLARLESQLSQEQISSMMTRAQSGQLSNGRLDPQFTLDSALIDTLLRLLKQDVDP
jgi:predicted ATPase/Tfp pilus assembly protein PilF